MIFPILSSRLLDKTGAFIIRFKQKRKKMNFFEQVLVMLLAEREEIILSLVQRQGVVSVHDLADACEATEVTIRRDLTRLEARNLLRRTHGGAVRWTSPPRITPSDPP